MNRTLAISIFVVGTLIIIVGFQQMETHLSNAINFLTLYGTFLSVFGLIIAYLQIISIKDATLKTKEAVELTTQKIAQILSVSDLAKGIKIIHESQNYITSSKHELLLIRLKDLKSILIQTKYNKDLVIFSQQESFIQMISDLSIDITNIHDLISGTKKGINFSKVNQNLEYIENILSDCENKLKNL